MFETPPTRLYESKEDPELVQLHLQGDERAAEELLFRYKKRVFNISYQFVGKIEEAEDLTQEIFMKIFNSLEKYNTEAKFQFWIVRVSKNYCIDHYRKMRKEREAIVDKMDHALQVMKTISNPQLDLEEKEKKQAIKDAISKLPTILRSCVMLRNIYGYSYQEIARILEIPEGTVKSRINRGRLELANKLQNFNKSSAE